MGIEYELKYAATAEQQAAIRRAYAGPWHTTAMETTYYDTPAGDLSARQFTLRRRLENGFSICTFKTPAGEQGRGEWECACDSITEAIPELWKLGAPQELSALVGAELVPICGARFTRQALLVALQDCTAELALDAGTLLGGSREVPLCEVEAELKSGSPEALETFAKAFAERFDLKIEPMSKFRRALALAQEESHGTA